MCVVSTSMNYHKSVFRHLQKQNYVAFKLFKSF